VVAARANRDLIPCDGAEAALTSSRAHGLRERAYNDLRRRRCQRCVGSAISEGGKWRRDCALIAVLKRGESAVVLLDEVNDD